MTQSINSRRPENEGGRAREQGEDDIRGQPPSQSKKERKVNRNRKR